MTPNYYVTNFYHFIRVPDLAELKSLLLAKAAALKLSGLAIIAPEGINATLSATDPGAIQAIQLWLKEYLKLPNLLFKDSRSDIPPFHQFKVKERPEIVTLGTPEHFPELNDPSRLSPEQWDEWLKSGRKFHLIDTRNSYEFKVGAFKGAINPNIRHFSEFPEVFVQDLNFPKDDPVLIYCTGGIRCEKATLELRRRGFEQVYQLDGGILKYLEKFPSGEFSGDCFVFDERVAVGPDLKPSKRYVLCPLCGDPADQLIYCPQCFTEAVLCTECLTHPACSKNCAYHLRRGSEPRKRPAIALDAPIDNR
jgi:UPF0176 protein